MKPRACICLTLLIIGVPVILSAQSANQREDSSSVNANEWIICPEAYGTSSYPGGTKGWFEHVKANMTPLAPPCKSGKVWVSFKVLKSGSLDSLQVLRGLCKLADQNALEIVRKSAPWNPECMKGEPIDSRIAISLSYRHK